MEYKIRSVRTEDANKLFKMLCELDKETKFMLFEPNEREKNPNAINNLKSKVELVLTGGDLVLVVEKAEDIIGFLWAERGKLNRVVHTACLVVGIRSNYQDLGIGKSLFLEFDKWARVNNIIRVELTVEVGNDRAKHLYEINGFEVEGIRRSSMFVDGRFVDEYYMSKIYFD